MSNGLDMQTAEESRPVTAPVETLSEKERAGVDLAFFVLWAIAGVLLFLGGYFVYVEARSFNELEAIRHAVMTDSKGYAPAEHLLAYLHREQALIRDHLLEVMQLILLNLLLPILTALLGYIFGTTRSA